MLAGALSELLRTGAQDPFAPEIICVPSRGVERWLTQQLSLVLGAQPGAYDGICANVEFPSPGRLVGEAVEAVSAIVGRSDPWRPGRSVWPLLELIEADPGLLSAASDPDRTQPVKPVAARAEGRSRQYAAARHVAELFDRYATYRPSMIVDWAAGDDTDGAGAPLPKDLRWQPMIWRRLRELVALPSPAERLVAACEQLRSDPTAAPLPGRLSLFGLTRLPPGQLAVLAALAEQRDIHLWLLHPCPPLWERVSKAGPQPTRRRLDTSARLVGHPLLLSLGRDVRELQLTVASAGVAVVDEHHALAEADSGTLPITLPNTLSRLQETLRADLPVAPQQRPLVPRGDRSVQIHACHGRARQVDVVRDVILGLLADDPTLEPRDVVVMCPDIETYAPLISATFGVGAQPDGAEASGDNAPASPAGLLRVRLADRSLRQTNPMMSVAATLLEFVDGRMTASEVLDLAGSAPVRRRFGFDDDDLSRLTDWVAESQIRWGLDAAHRAAFKLDAFPQNTWEAGLDRLLLGVAMAEGPAGGDAAGEPAGIGWVGLALPLDDVDSTDIELVGRLAELVQRLRAAVDALRGPQSLAEWIAALSAALESLASTSAAELWQAAQLRSELASVLDAAGDRAGQVSLTLADLRSLLADRLRGRPTRANFRTGSLTMCTLVPMRSVPHRVVCLLGLDDGAFPRQPAIDGDDILRRDPMTGERDERSEDRQLLLDAILAAGDHLVITYSGADERTNARRPPSVPVGELLDTLDASFTSEGTAGPQPARAQLVVHHPLQPFDPKNFSAWALGVDRAFSFEPASLAGAKALVSARRPAPPFLVAALAPVPRTDLEFETLRQFFEHPIRGFLRQRLGVTLPRRAEEAADRLPIELNALERWTIGQRMLDSRLSGVDQASCRQAEWRRGALPPGRLGGRVLNDVATEVDQVVVEAEGLRQSSRQTFDLAVELPSGRRLTGTVSGVHDATLIHTSFGSVNQKRRFRAWLALMLLAAGRPDEQFRAVAVGRKSQVRFGPVSGTEALHWLSDLVALYEAGLCEPLPISSKASYEYACARRRGAEPDEAVKAAAVAWDGGRFPGEKQDPEHIHVYGVALAFPTLIAAAPANGDSGDWAQEPSRFGMLSRRWWEPLLEAEQRGRG